MTATVVLERRMPADETQDRIADLVSAARAGDRLALEALLESIERRVYLLAYRLIGEPASAEDVAQDVLWKICGRLDQYAGSNFWGWVYRIVVNQVHDHRRAAGPAPAELLGLAAPVDYHPARQEQWRRVMEAMRVLTEKERAALVLTEIEGFSSREAARVLGCLPITVRVRAAHARQKVRRALSRYYPELRETT